MPRQDLIFLLLEESDSVVDALYNTTKLKAKS